ncbi:Modification methylase HpaII [Botrimarina colliarenosi]|uniref:DNA (cytosine-5-)-methyltransferase n=1 Tax=Botrimarina colliarenosi TaxID=2528001 RepID=A0A5C6AFN6_9BACT|nr:DNA (cytosine-5-)-methyltransferase [Botrimarina colliarenosi]TWT98005.1 Modification methylase HpaII [Botrimarina colliarenosi]
MDPQHPLFDASPAPPAVAGRTAAEFFAGVGLARMGLERAGWEVVFANDIEPAKQRMHDGHFGPSPHYHVGDIHDLARDPAQVPPALLAHASFPCTDLSLAGSRKGLNEGQSSAFWGWIELIKAMAAPQRPKLLLIENVTGLLSSNNGADFRALVAAINDLGYAADVMMVDAAHFTPQSRPRLFVVGVAEALQCVTKNAAFLKNSPPPGGEGLGEGGAAGTRLNANKAGARSIEKESLYPGSSPLPDPPHRGEGDSTSSVLGRLGVDELQASTVRPAKLVEAIRANSDLHWDLWDLPEPPPYGVVQLEEVVDRLPGDSPQWWSTERADYLLNQMSDRHRQTADQMIAGKRLSYGAVFRRVRKGRSMAELRTDGLAGCLRTPKGGSGRQILFEAGRGAYRVRLMNPDECARLMGADGYRVNASLNQALFGFGDAVCVDAVAWVAQHRLNPVAAWLAQDAAAPSLP